MSQVRLSAKELHITQPEYDALLWVRDALDPTISDHALPAWMRFDMNHWGHISAHEPLEEGCGTVCCIGGSMGMHMAGLTSDLKVGDTPSPRQAVEWMDQLRDLTDSPSGSDSLHPLFHTFPELDEDRTREKAVEAIDRWLAGNTEDPWLTRDA